MNLHDYENEIIYLRLQSLQKNVINVTFFLPKYRLKHILLNLK